MTTGAAQSGNIYLDAYRVRKYVSSEPTYTIGAEETPTTSGITVGITHSPTAQTDLALDPENNITSITVDYNAIFNKNNVVVTYYRAYDGDTNATLVEGNDDANYVVFSRTYTVVGDYNTCVYVEAVDDQNNTFTDTACVVLHVDEYPQNLSFDWNQHIPFPNETITFTGSATDNGTLTFNWDFGDTATATGNPATHSYTSAGTYTVTLTVTDDVGLSKSVTKSVPVYSVPDLNWTPIKPHAQEPTTIKVVYDSRLDINATVWNVLDTIVVDQNRYATTVKFQHYGVKTVDATITLTDGTNVRDYNLTADINVVPIKWTFNLLEEDARTSFDITKTDSNKVNFYLEASDGTVIMEDINATQKTVELNDFPVKVSVSYTVGGIPILRSLYFRVQYYERNQPILLPDPTIKQVLQVPFYIQDQTGQFNDPIFIVSRLYSDGTLEMTSAKKDAEGKVVTFLYASTPYILSVWQNGVEKSIGTFTPVTATPVTVTIGGWTLSVGSPFFECTTTSEHFEGNDLVLEFNSCKEITMSVFVYSTDGNLVYSYTFQPTKTGVAKALNLDPNLDYRVVWTNGLAGKTVWVSGSRLVSLGLPPTFYTLVSLLLIFAPITLVGALGAWFGGLVSIGMAILLTVIGWISLPILILVILAGVIVLGRWEK